MAPGKARRVPAYISAIILNDLPKRSNRQAGELGRQSFRLNLHGRYVLHVRGNDLLSAQRLNREEGNLQYEG